MIALFCSGLLALTTAGGNDLARVEDVEQHHGDEHERRVKAVQPALGMLQRAAKPLAVLDGAEQGPYEDEGRDGVEDKHEALPRHRDRLGRRRRLPHHAHVEDGRDNDEDGEADQLDRQTADDDVLARLETGRVLGAGEKAASTRRLIQSVKRFL